MTALRGAKPDLSELKTRLGIDEKKKEATLTEKQLAEIGMLLTLEKAKSKVVQKTLQKLELQVATSLIANNFGETTVLSMQAAIEEGREELKTVMDGFDKFFAEVIDRLSDEEREQYRQMVDPGK